MEQTAAMSNRLAGALVFFTSGAVLVLEILAGRLLAPYVGVSIETFTGIIGVVLAGIAVGAWLGGGLADRFDPRMLLPGAVTLGGGLAIAAVPLVRLFGPSSPDADPGTIVVLATVSFFAPSAVLTSVTPIVVKLQLRELEHTGRVVGSLSAMGTAGALVGVFTTGFVLVAAFPTTPVVITLGALLAAAGIGLWFHLRRQTPQQLIVAGVAIAAVSAGVATVAAGPCEVESAYFCARVDVDPDRASGRALWLDTLRHSYVDLADPTHLELTYTQVLGDVVDAVAPTGDALDVVHVGGGGFTMPRYVEATRPGSDNLVLELDEEVVDLAERELGLQLDDDLRVVTGDARIGIADLPSASADLIVGDAFGGRAVPWHLATREFVTDIARVLRPDGVLAQNVIDLPPLGFLRAELATMRDVFEHVAVIAPAPRLAGHEGGNFIILASDRPLPLDDILAANAARGDDDQALGDAEAVDDFIGGADVLTDEHAPVDQLISS
jgi:SAM-dependent methyltransferase